MRSLLAKYPSILIITILCLIAFGYFKYVYVGEKFTSPLKAIDEKIHNLEKDKKSLMVKLDSIEKVTSELYVVVDSLEHLKPKIKIKYVEKYHQIDSSNVTNISQEFDSIFAVRNIK